MLDWKNILNAFARKEHLKAIFFDIQKAYDTTWWYHILQTIHSLGIRGTLAHFIGNFLSDRKFQVRVDTTLSQEFSEEEGVPQGSVFIVALFAVAVNGILAYVPNEVSKSIYVDDVAIYYASHNINSRKEVATGY